MVAFIAGFSRPFLLTIGLWPFLSLVLTIPVLALLYHRDNRLSFSSALMSYLVVLYVLALGCFTLYPLPANPAAFCAVHHLTPQLDPFRFIHDIRADGLTAVLQLVMNVLFFLPLGFFMGRTFRWKLRLALPVAFMVSLLIETAQLTGVFYIYPCAYRLFDVDDLITNTLGAVIGYGCAMIVNRVFPWETLDESVVETRPGFIRRAVALSIDMVLVVVVQIALSLMVWLALGMPGGDVANARYAVPIQIVSFLLVEGVTPWLRGGRTLGGGFTRMTIETNPRYGWRRLLFYAVRLIVLYVVVCGSSLWPSSPVPGLLALALCLWWLIRRKMPYDLI